MIYRPVNFNYFYDPAGNALIKLVRKLADIRHARAEMRGGDHFFYSDPGSYTEYISRGVMLFNRSQGNSLSLIALNFTDQDVPISITVPLAGAYTDQIDGVQNFNAGAANVSFNVTVKSNYGCIWTVN